jgi:hypothetical protein
MSLPIYQINDIVYLIESANLGFIESYRVSELRQDASGVWIYKIAVTARPGTLGQTYGDRITLQPFDADFELAESALCNYCDAISRALVAARANVARLEQLQAAQCEESGT